MAEKHPHGLFSWADVTVPDPAAAKRFYTSLFGWEGEEQFDADGNYIYTMFTLDGKTVAGMGPLPKEQQDQGVPPLWNSYVSVDSVDDALGAVEDAGGKVMFARDVTDTGRMAYIIDTVGAVVALWEARGHEGGQVFSETGAMSWNELSTRDPERARTFYSAVFPWTFERTPGDMEYWVINLEDRQNGGIITMTDEWPADTPPSWMVYFNVDDVDSATAQARDLGGQVVVEPFTTEAGKIAVMRDPQGALFSVIAPTEAGASGS